jgi:hypothetical protein
MKRVGWLVTFGRWVAAERWVAGYVMEMGD